MAGCAKYAQSSASHFPAAEVRCLPELDEPLPGVYERELVQPRTASGSSAIGRPWAAHHPANAAMPEAAAQGETSSGEILPEHLGTARMPELGQGLRLDLADPLSGDPELAADLL
jgi:hypothetical protein